MPSLATFTSALAEAHCTPNTRRIMNENAERINGLAAMLGVIAAMGAYATTGQIIPGIW
jgi:hypothetical protein